MTRLSNDRQGNVYVNGVLIGRVTNWEAHPDIPGLDRFVHELGPVKPYFVSTRRSLDDTYEVIGGSFVRVRDDDEPEAYPEASTAG